MSTGYAIGGGPGNEAAPKRFENFKAGEAISKGEVVAISGTADDGYTVVLADVDAAATYFVKGVATADVASGDWGVFQTYGWCEYIVTDGNVADGQVLIADATPGAATGAAHGTAANGIFGQAYAADASTLLTAAFIDCGY